MSDRREFLELAHNFEPKKHLVTGWLLSIKLDGHRAFYDGGITRGMDPQDVPWANTSKDARYIERPKSTGLWSRGGKTIQAPEWWLDALPVGVPLDGELWGGRGLFQKTSSTVKQLYPNDADWHDIRYMVFDSPSWHAFARIGRINTPNFTKEIHESTWKFITDRVSPAPLPASWSYDIAISSIPKTPNLMIWTLLPQEKLPASRKEVAEVIETRLAKCEVDGDEGLMLRHPNQPWEPKRSNNLLKVKRRHDAEAEVVGYVWGRKTDRGSKLLGLMGAIIVRTLKSEKIREGIIFELSGFTDQERAMVFRTDLDCSAISPMDRLEGQNKPGEKVSPYWINKKFPIGSTLTYKYRETTDDGVPKEAQYFRPKGDL